jgi:amidase
MQARSATLPNGPFHGVPLLLKDYLCHTAGDPYYAGTRFLIDLDWREQHDTYLAAKFRAAGFVFVAKTNLPELANSPTTDDSAVFGRTNNPWSVGCSPGGSSSGSCAAVAAGLVPIAHANDGTGSIRIPASACGLVGLKPSRGRVSAGPGRVPNLLGNVSEHVVARFGTAQLCWTQYAGPCQVICMRHHRQRGRSWTKWAMRLVLCVSVC